MRIVNYILAIAVAGFLTACATTHSINSAQQAKPMADDNSLDSQLDKLGQEISGSLSQQTKSKIAVIEFTDLNGNGTNLGKYLAEELTTKLFTSGKFQVIERRLIEKILKEQQLSMTGVVDEKTAMKVGSLLGANVIATGTTADLGTSIKINARTISVERGTVLSVASVMISKNDQVKMLMGKHGEPAAEAINLSRERYISGTWKFVCCSGKYWGETVLTMDESNKITGQFYDRANKSGGTIEGTVNGNMVLFTRNKGEQDYKLTLSSDGGTMSGFFVGNHDGSVGTEVTMTRKNPIDSSSAENVFTPWRGGDEFGREMDKYWKDGYYPAVVEGRNHDGRSEFRAALQPFPKRGWWFYWWYDQLGSSYEEHRKKLTTEGFREIHVQVFIDGAGMRKYQTCWIKYAS